MSLIVDGLSSDCVSFTLSTRPSFALNLNLCLNQHMIYANVDLQCMFYVLKLYLGALNGVVAYHTNDDPDAHVDFHRLWSLKLIPPSSSQPY